MGSNGINSKLVELRRRYTGEANLTALKAIRASRIKLDASDIAAAAQYLDHDHARPEMDDVDRAMLRRVGAALLPSTDDLDQRVLERALFESAHKAVEWGILFPPASEMRRIHAISAVTPNTDSAPVRLKIKLGNPYMLGPLLDSLLPIESNEYGSEDDSISGLPGLRTYRHGSSLFLRLLGTSANVEVIDVGPEDASAADKFRQDAVGDFSVEGRPTRLTHPTTMTANETHVLDLWRSRSARCAIYSQLLRRISLFSESLRVDTWATTHSVICEWIGRLKPADVAEHLLHPMTGIEGFNFARFYGLNSVNLERGERSADHTSRGPRLTLRRQDSLPLDDDTMQRWRSQPTPSAVQNWVTSRSGQRAAEEYAQGTVARRAQATGEPHALIPAGHPETIADLDRSSPAQTHLRALLALHVFNHHRLGDPIFAPALLSQLSYYTMKISPRWDNLVIISNAPDNIVRRLLPDSGSPGGLPGLRLLRVDSDWVHHLYHPPTGARLTVTSRGGSFTSIAKPPSIDERVDTARWRPSLREAAPITEWPKLSVDERRLLAALFIRMSTQSPDGLWTVGGWSYDPFQRTESDIDAPRRLTRDNEHWELTWSEVPFLYDVAASFIDPYTRLHGAVLKNDYSSITVTVGSASLVLRGPDDPSVLAKLALTGQS